MCSCCNELANRYMNDAYIYSEYNNKPMLPYCPNCGADMRGDRE
nr:MAG TPA: zinc-ribbon domain protein [Caudoviricetes sp.]